MPKVSVVMVTYNHEAYIHQAVASVLRQEVDFAYELLIGEDCSTDHTREIAITLQQTYPDKIRLLLHETNQGPTPNYMALFRLCQGQYMAILDGDDYWTDVHKLQRQVAFMDQHPECALCFHDAITVSANGNREIGQIARPGQKAISELADLVERNFIPNCTVMYRNHLVSTIPAWVYDMPMGDWCFHILYAQKGKIGYLDKVMAAYRKQPKGIYSGLGLVAEIQAWMVVHHAINAHLDYTYSTIINRELHNRQNRLHVALVEVGFQLGRTQSNLSQVNSIFDNWPQRWPLNCLMRRKILGDIYERLLFQSYQDYDWPKVRQCWLRLILYKPISFLNKGVWAIGLRSFWAFNAAH
jgi:glycosyltransferase involved in cell wall biosynthesis